MKKIKKRWFLVAILFLGLIIFAWKFLIKEKGAPIKEEPGIEAPGISERVVLNEKKSLEKWTENLHYNIGEFNILVAGEFFILFADQKDNNETDEIKESIYNQIEQRERVFPDESFFIFFTQGKSNESWILRISFEYGQGKFSQRPIIIYYLKITHNIPPLNLKNANMDHDKPYKTIDFEPFVCYFDDVEKIIEKYASRYDLESGIGVKALRKELIPCAKKVAKEFFEVVKDKI